MNRDAGDPVIGDLVLARSDHRGTGGLPKGFPLDFWLDYWSVFQYYMMHHYIMIYYVGFGYTPEDLRHRFFRSFLRRPLHEAFFVFGSWRAVWTDNKFVSWYSQISWVNTRFWGRTSWRPVHVLHILEKNPEASVLHSLHTMELLHRRTDWRFQIEHILFSIILGAPYHREAVFRNSI